MGDPNWHVVLVLGILLGVALMAGALAGFVRIPKVTAYLLVGALLGPSALQWIEMEQIGLLEPLTKLAIALVLFNLGCHFTLARARRILRRVMRLSAGELTTTFLLVFLGLGLVHGSWELALLLGALALATAPATTVLVLKETESEGPVTESTNALVAINNLVSILLFELFFLTIHYFHNQLASPWSELGQLAWDIAGSVSLGIAGGLIAAFTYTLVSPDRRLVLG